MVKWNHESTDDLSVFHVRDFCSYIRGAGFFFIANTSNPDFKYHLRSVRSLSRKLDAAKSLSATRPAIELNSTTQLRVVIDECDTFENDWQPVVMIPVVLT